MDLRTLLRRMAGPVANLLRRAGRTARADSPAAREWEWYARAHRRERSGRFLGEEWNRPEVIGADVPPGDLLRHFDEKLVEPLLSGAGTVLELGPGGGRFTALLLARAGKVIAADTSPTMLRLLRRRFPGESRLVCLELDGSCRLPLADRAADAAFAYDVFVHLRHWEIFLYLKELARVVAPGGPVVIHHANTFSELGWRRFLGEATEVGRGEVPKAAFSLMTPEVMAELARRAGLVPERCLLEVARRDAVSVLRVPGRA